MAKVKQKTQSNNELSKDRLIELYMNYVLENEEEPGTVYKFCKENDITEAEFYNFFGSFDGLKKGIWERFFEHTLGVMQSSKEYMAFNNREKMLTLYYTFFEMLTANRSYVLFTLKNEGPMLKNAGQLKGLRKEVKNYTAELIRQGNEEKQAKILKRSETIFSEAAWVQLMFLIKFWMDDNSPQFESTDVAIEKSVNTVFDLFENTPLESVLDLGKFLWKEKMA
ncbi:TetR family transcriptional regulator C-terminal domain-containing protein [Salinimicrobium xinjiangense]|uniref:TetR family transcriptional regulator C-terminal domain-containing protein n=1 Tax=Salinimicrobium xinjiangense TaxID=438596 RepID=UPI000401ACD6|nr:TetR family transcriptional regulator C-terminal domain-containing protein [Salinimicrobium xinjiangense]